MVSNINFRSATHVYFYTDQGKPIVSDENIRKCGYYLSSHLNGSKNYKTLNYDLRNKFAYDKARQIGDKDYYCNRYTRSVYDDTKPYMTILSGNDACIIDNCGRDIGISKKISLEKNGNIDTFETHYAKDRYFNSGHELSDKRGIYKDSLRQAFGVVFKPIYKKNGELKNFEYIRSGFFDEHKITNK